MLKIHNNEKRVIETYIQYNSTGEIEPFCQEAGVWIMRHLRQDLGSTEDEASEMFFFFLKKMNKILELQNGREPEAILSLLAIYSKNFLKNCRRRDKSQFEEEYFKLWDMNREKDYTELSQSSVLFLKSILRKVERENRIILSLRYNIHLSARDTNYLIQQIERNRLEPELFYKNREEKMILLLEKQNKLLEKINYFNQKIYNNKKNYKRNNKKQKEKVLEKLISKDELFTIKEISELLNISRYKINKICQDTIEVIKEEFSKRAA